MITTIYLQNIISPYRARFFNTLAKYDSEFAVYYMGETEPDKFWDVSKIKMDYPYWVDKSGLYLRPSKRFGTHLNIRLLYKILFNKDVKNIVLAVSWTDLNVFIIALLKKAHLTRKRLFFWAEANYTAEWAKRHNNRLKRFLKRVVFSAIDGAMIIPGHMAEITFEKWGISLSRVIYLPNTINDSELVYQENSKTSSRTNPRFIMPMRIIERVKGGLNFFRSIGRENINKAIFYVTGDGVDYLKYESFIKDNDYSEHIIMKGFCGTDQMRDLYNEVDGFILPSFSDPSPLSVIEALHMHLPLLISSHCGNHFEAIKVGENGFIFDPDNPEDIKTKFELFMERSSDWLKMGDISAKIYEETFKTDLVVDHYIEQFNQVKL